MELRSAEPGDVDAICVLHAAAFEASRYGHNGEAELVRALHDDGDSLLSLCGWRDGALIGHILFSRMDVEADGIALGAAALAPVSVAPVHRCRGVAGALIRAGHDGLMEQGIRIAFVLGDTGYYTRFGYDPAFAAPFASPYAGSHFMACLLDSTVPKPQRGVATHAPAFARLA